MSVSIFELTNSDGAPLTYSIFAQASNQTFLLSWYGKQVSFISI
jgi:hypothetical protein